MFVIADAKSMQNQNQTIDDPQMYLPFCLFCLHFLHWECVAVTESVQGEHRGQRASRDSNDYNREAEDEHCTVLVMLPLGWDTGHHDLDVKHSYNQNFDSSPITSQEMFVMFIAHEFIEFCRGKKCTHIFFFNLKFGFNWIEFILFV